MPSIPRAAWSRPTSNDEAARRAAGRARYNAWRSMLKAQRRLLAMRLLAAGLTTSQIAAELGAAPRTIRRDLAALMAEGSAAHRCPLCGSGPFFEEEPGAGGWPLPWTKRGALEALRRAAAWQAGDFAHAFERDFESDLLEEEARHVHQAPNHQASPTDAP